MLSPEENAEIDAELATVARPRGACIGALHVVQRRRGWVDDATLADVAAKLGMSPAELDGVATYYNLIYRRPVGRHVVLLCNSVSCWLMGAGKLQRAVERATGTTLGHTSSDGRFTILPNPCLGCCDHAPAMMIGEDLHRDAGERDVGAIVERYK
jgi:NADH-quinone oxidoreductase subunit E